MKAEEMMSNKTSGTETNRRVRAGDVDVYTAESGTGAPILFLHGVPDSANVWQPVVRHLESSYRCVAPDLPGLGRSTAPADFDLSLDHRAEFVDQLVAALGLPLPINLVVHDFGGTYGLPWACLHPDKLSHLAIFSVNFFPDYKWHQNAKLWRTPLLGELSMAMVNESLFTRTMHSGAPRLPLAYIHDVYSLSMTNPQVKKMILKLYRQTNPESFATWQGRLQTLMSRVPSIVLWGDKDPYIAPGFAERFGARKVEHFAEGGHWLPLEEPGKVAEALGTFFAQ